MATHSSILAWRIPCTEEAGRLQSTGSQRVGHDWSDLANKYSVYIHTHLQMFHIYRYRYIYHIYLKIRKWVISQRSRKRSENPKSLQGIFEEGEYMGKCSVSVLPVNKECLGSGYTQLCLKQLSSVIENKHWEWLLASAPRKVTGCLVKAVSVNEKGLYPERGWAEQSFLHFSICWLNRSSKQTLFPELCWQRWWRRHTN